MGTVRIESEGDFVLNLMHLNYAKIWPTLDLYEISSTI